MDAIQAVNYINFVGAEYFPTKNTERRVKCTDGAEVLLSDALMKDLRNVTHVQAVNGDWLDMKQKAEKNREVIRAAVASSAARAKLENTDGKPIPVKLSSTGKPLPVPSLKPIVDPDAPQPISTKLIEGVVEEVEHARRNERNGEEVFVILADVGGELLSHIERHVGCTVRIKIEVMKGEEKDE